MVHQESDPLRQRVPLNGVQVLCGGSSVAKGIACSAGGGVKVPWPPYLELKGYRQRALRGCSPTGLGSCLSEGTNSPNPLVVGLPCQAANFRARAAAEDRRETRSVADLACWKSQHSWKRGRETCRLTSTYFYR